MWLFYVTNLRHPKLSLAFLHNIFGYIYYVGLIALLHTFLLTVQVVLLVFSAHVAGIGCCNNR